MKTLKLLIKMSLFNKSMILCASMLSNKSLMEEATKCLFRTSLRSTHSTSHSPRSYILTQQKQAVSHTYTQDYILEMCMGMGFPMGTGMGM